MNTNTAQAAVIPATPECEKWAAVSGKIHTILDFLAWAQDDLVPSRHLCTKWESGDYIPDIAPSKMEHLLMQHFGIDPRALEQERKALLEFARNNCNKDENISTNG